MYFLEIADYFTRENNDEREVLKLLYQTMRALLCEGIENTLIRYIFQWKMFVINGEYPDVFSCNCIFWKKEMEEWMQQLEVHYLCLADQ